MTFTARPPFFMIRHGETDWNREKRYQGRVDVPLNALGRRQAAANGRFLAEFDHDWSQWRFIASPLGRARETMEILRTQLGLDPLAYVTDGRLVEVSFGLWERKLAAELASEDAEEMALRDADKWSHVPPGGESYAEAATRVTDFLGELVEPAVIVCHGGILRATQHVLGEQDVQALAAAAVPQDRVFICDGERAFWSD